MEQFKTINGLRVYVGGSWYEISDPRKQEVLFFGNCEEGCTPRQVYDQHYPRNARDGLLHDWNTLFFIHESFLGFSNEVQVGHASLDICDISEAQEGYALRYIFPFQDRWREITWTERPRIIMINSRVELPPNLLYDIRCKGNDITKISRFSAFDHKQLDTVASWLDNVGYVWFYM